MAAAARSAMNGAARETAVLGKELDSAPGRHDDARIERLGIERGDVRRAPLQHAAQIYRALIGDLTRARRRRLAQYQQTCNLRPTAFARAIAHRQSPRKPPDPVHAVPR